MHPSPEITINDQVEVIPYSTMRLVKDESKMEETAERLKIIAALVPEGLKHRVTIVDIFFVLCTNDTAIKNEEISSFLDDFAKSENVTTQAFFEGMDKDIENSSKNGFTPAAQFQLIVNSLDFKI